MFVENIDAAVRFEFEFKRLIDSNAVASLAERFAKVSTTNEKTFDRAIVGAHAKDHRHSFIDGQIIEPAVTDTERSERSHRQRHIIWKLRAQVAQERAIEIAF